MVQKREVQAAVSERTIGRLSLYRRLLAGLLADGVQSVFSHQLARLACSTPAQVRRDLMTVGYRGSPVSGYDVPRLLESLRECLDAPGGQGVVLVGVGNLGKAILSYFRGRRPSLEIVAAFDNDPAKTGRIIHGCRCWPMERLGEVVREQKVRTAVITVPAADAQKVAEAAVEAGVGGLLNFAPVRLRVPPQIHVEDMDMSIALEKVAYFSRHGAGGKGLIARTTSTADRRHDSNVPVDAPGEADPEE
jgi:redox-sensing transcriptional repressor